MFSFGVWGDGRERRGAEGINIGIPRPHFHPEHVSPSAAHPASRQAPFPPSHTAAPNQTLAVAVSSLQPSKGQPLTSRSSQPGPARPSSASHSIKQGAGAAAASRDEFHHPASQLLQGSVQPGRTRRNRATLYLPSIRVTYLGEIWAKWDEGTYRGLLLVAQPWRGSAAELQFGMGQRSLF